MSATAGGAAPRPRLRRALARGRGDPPRGRDAGRGDDRRGSGGRPAGASRAAQHPCARHGAAGPCRHGEHRELHDHLRHSRRIPRPREDHQCRHAPARAVPARPRLVPRPTTSTPTGTSSWSLRSPACSRSAAAARGRRFAAETAAGPLHKFGKICIPLPVLVKRSALTRAERRALEQHTVAGHVLLCHYTGDPEEFTARVARDHHERRDRSGYPRAVELADPLVEIVAVCDVYDALVSPRPYRAVCLRHRTALEELTAMAEGGHRLGGGAAARVAQPPGAPRAGAHGGLAQEAREPPPATFTASSRTSPTAERVRRRRPGRGGGAARRRRAGAARPGGLAASPMAALAGRYVNATR